MASWLARHEAQDGKGEEAMTITWAYVGRGNRLHAILGNPMPRNPVCGVLGIRNPIKGEPNEVEKCESCRRWLKRHPICVSWSDLVFSIFAKRASRYFWERV